MLTFIQTAEGRVTKSGSVWTYEYNLKDHLGNVRASFRKSATGTAELLQKNDYYPFGLTFNSFSSGTRNNYLYNQGSGGKTFPTERQDELGVDLTRYRTYDLALGRWWQVDPKADLEDLVSWTPYNYSYNNPILFNDPDGDCPMCIGAVLGAIGGAVAGAIMGKSGQEILAMAVGGAVAGATFGLGTVAVGAAGGIATIGGAGSAYIIGASGIAGAALGNAAEQGTKIMLGVQENMDGNEIVLSGSVGMAEAVLGGAGDVASESLKGGLKSFTSRQLQKSTSQSAQKEFKKEVVGRLRSAGAGHRQARTAANTLTRKMVKEKTTEADVLFKVTGKAVDMTIKTGVNVGNEVIKDEIKGNE